MFQRPTRTTLAALFVAVLLPGTASSDATVAVNDIFTNVDDIATYVESVTYGTPVVVDVPNVGKAYEVHGTVSGVGWGGGQRRRALDCSGESSARDTRDVHVRTIHSN